MARKRRKNKKLINRLVLPVVIILAVISLILLFMLGIKQEVFPNEGLSCQTSLECNSTNLICQNSTCVLIDANDFYRFTNNECVLMSLLPAEVTSNDYPTFLECEVFIIQETSTEDVEEEVMEDTTQDSSSSSGAQQQDTTGDGTAESDDSGDDGGDLTTASFIVIGSILIIAGGVIFLVFRPNSTNRRTRKKR